MFKCTGKVYLRTAVTVEKIRAITEKYDAL